MMKVRTFIMAVAFVGVFVGCATDTYAWGKRKKKEVQIDTVAVKKSRYDELTKKAKTREGLFKIHQVEKDWYFEISDSLLGRDILIVNKVSGVPYELNDAGLNKGMAYEDRIIRFYKDTTENKVWVTTYNPKITSPEGDAITRSVKDNYRESVIEQFPIEAQNGDSTSVVIKVKDRKSVV